MDNFNGIDPKYLALIQAGMGILAANTGKQPAGAAIGTGLLGGVAGYQENLQQQQKQALLQQQMEMQKQELGLKQKEYDQKLQQKSAEEKRNEQILQYLGIGTPPSQVPQDAPIDYNILNPTQPIPTQQPKGMDRETLYKLGVALSLTGGHGGETLIKYADTMKPNLINAGDRWVDSNKFQGEIPISPAPMSRAEEARLRDENIIPQDNSMPSINQTVQPVQPQAQPQSPAQQSYKYNPALSPKANRELAVKEAGLAIESKYKPAQLTTGQESVDREFGKEYAAYKASGGYSDVLKQLSQLKVASDALAVKGNSLTGKLYGLTPESIRPYTNPEAVNNQELVQEAAQRNLRIVLGAQFTEKEGNRLIERVYNPSLPPEVNKLRVDRLAEQISLAAKAKDDAMAYFEKNGTLKGWTGKIYTMSDFESAIDGKNKSGPIKKTVEQKDISKMPKSVITKIGGKSVTLKLGNDGLYYDDKGNGYSK